jgi:hypothetical protein
MTTIRQFKSYADAARAAVEAVFRFVTDTNRDPLTRLPRESGRSFAPTIRYRHPVTGEEIEVLWANDRGAIRRLTAKPTEEARA